MKHFEMKPCPFCGCEMIVHQSQFKNGDDRIEPYGWHSDDCIMNETSWHTYPEDGWTEEKIADAWNKRVEGR